MPTKTKLSQAEFDQASKPFDLLPTRSSSLDAVCYLNAKFLEVENQQIFHKSWQFLCHEEKLDKPGSYVCASIQGQPVIAVRNRTDELKAYYNVCKHRGHELADGEGVTSKLTCPYHAWSYDLDGKLVNAPRTDSLIDFETSEINLTRVQIEVFCHLVFINLDSTADSLTNQTENLGQEIMKFAPDLANLTFSRRLTYNVKANWKAVIDNFLECYHCPGAHKGFSSMFDMQTYKVTTHNIYSSHLAKARTGTNSAYNIDSATVDDHAVWFLWPNITLMRYPGRGNFMVWRFFPVSESETWEEFDFFYEESEPNELEQESLKFIDEVLQVEDINLVESVQRGMNSPAFTSGRFVIDPDGGPMSEHAVHHFHSLLLGAYRKAVSEG